MLTVASNPVTGEGEQRNVLVQPEWVCGGNAIAIKSNELNAWTNGRNISITSSMLRFATSDEELALVIGHEMAHNIMGHIQAQRTNAAMGSIFGALFDIVAATQGVNTNGDFTRAGGEIGAMQFSQEFELEADYVGLYLMARSGIPMDGALEFWRRMAAEDPDMIQFASSHPTAPRRFVGLESALQEIEGKRRAGEPLVPTLKKDTLRSEEKR
jgi:predicted Zn-dependent protease